MTKIHIEGLFSLEKARKMFPGPPSMNTIHIWTSTGVNGVKLRTIRIGRRLFTDREAVEEFILAQNREPDEQ